MVLDPKGLRDPSGLSVTLTLTDFVIPPDDVPEEVSRAIKHWSQWIRRYKK